MAVRRVGLFAALAALAPAVLLSDAAAAADDAYLASIDACLAKRFEDVAPAMTALGAAPLAERDIDQFKVGIAKGQAMGAYLIQRKSGTAPLASDMSPMPTVLAWRLPDGDATIIVMVVTFGGAAPGFICDATIDGDRAAAAIDRLSQDRGAPETTIALKDGTATVWPSGVPVATYVLSVTLPSRPYTLVEIFQPGGTP